VAKGFDVIIGLVSISLIARYLGVGDFGKYAFVRALCSVLVIVANMGLPTIMIREIARDRDKAPVYFVSSLFLMLVFSAISLGILFLVITLIHVSPEVRHAVYCMGLAAVFLIFGDLFSALFRAFEKMEYEALKSIINQIAYITMVVLVIHFDLGFLAVFAALLFANLLDMVLGAVLASKKFIRPGFRMNFSMARFILFETVPLGLGLIIRKLILRIDVLLLTAMKSKAEVGLFGAVYRLITQLRVLPNISRKVTLPIFSRLAVGSKDDLIQGYERSFKFFFVLYLPITIALVLLADKVVLLVFGKEFLPSTIVLQILGIALLFMFLNTHLLMVLTAINRQKTVMVNTVFCLITNVVLDILLIPIWSYVGASIGTLAAEIVLFISCFLVVSREIHAIRLHRMIWKPLFCAVVMGGFLLALHQFSIFLLLPLGAIVYFSLLFVVGTFSSDETVLIKQAISFPGLRALKFSVKR
jgi:O-antigen/teichoic acid export membrane protein